MGHVGRGLANTEVRSGRQTREHGVAGLLNAIDVIQLADAAGDDRHWHGFCHGAGEVEVKADFAPSRSGGQQDLARTPARGVLGPGLASIPVLAPAAVWA